MQPQTYSAVCRGRGEGEPKHGCQWPARWPAELGAPQKEMLEGGRRVEDRAKQIRVTLRNGAKPDG